MVWLATGSRRMWRMLCGMLLAGSAAALGGCQAVGAAAYVLSGPPTVPAKYTPAMEPMAILVENYRNPSVAYLDSEQLAHRIYDNLKEHEVAPLIEPAEVTRLRDAQGVAAFRQMSVAAVGRAVGAKQVLYVNVLDSAVETVPSDVIQGQIELRVQIIDAQTGAARWPKDGEEFYPLKLETPLMVKTHATNAVTARDSMLDSAALSVSRWFYEWKME